MWDLPRPGIGPVSPALAGGLLTTGSVLLPGKSHGRRSLVGHSPWCRRESNTTERLHFHFHQGSLDLNFWCSVLQPDFSWPLAPGQTVWFSGPGSQPAFSSCPTYTLALVLVCILVVCMLLSNWLNLCATAFPIVTWGFYNSILEIQYLRAVLTQDDLPLGHVWQCLEIVLVVKTGGWLLLLGGIYWADAKNTDVYLQCTGQPLTT